MEISAPAYRPVLVLGVLAGLLATGLLHLTTPGPATTPTPAAAVAPAIDVLHEWDRRRASAYATGDAHALADLYVPGSTAAMADVALLRTYARRGLRVLHLRTQVFSVRVQTRSDDVLRIEVVDRIAGGTVLGRTRCLALPRDYPATQQIELHRVAGRWLVSSVRDA